MTDFAGFERAGELDQEAVLPRNPLVRIGAAIGDLTFRIIDRGPDPVDGIRARMVESDLLLAELDAVVGRLPQSQVE